MTSFQTISYYLSKRHPNRTPTPKNQAFQEYINTLPRSFQEIPLCLILEYFFGDLNRIRIQDYHLINPIETRLSSRSFHHSMDRFQVLGVMTSSMKEKCDEVTQRFLLDWRSVSGIKTDEDEEELVTLDQFLWGWLNGKCRNSIQASAFVWVCLDSDLDFIQLEVNTRCLWFDLGLKDHDDNITLAPVIDMVCKSTNPHQTQSFQKKSNQALDHFFRVIQRLITHSKAMSNRSPPPTPLAYTHLIRTENSGPQHPRIESYPLNETSVQSINVYHIAKEMRFCLVMGLIVIQHFGQSMGLLLNLTIVGIRSTLPRRFWICLWTLMIIQSKDYLFLKNLIIGSKFCNLMISLPDLKPFWSSCVVWFSFLEIIPSNLPQSVLHTVP